MILDVWRNAIVYAISTEGPEKMTAAVQPSPSLWFIIRELYGSGVICVANRGHAAVGALVDCSALSGIASFVCDESLRLPRTQFSANVVVAPGCTTVVGILQPPSGGGGFASWDREIRVHEVPPVTGDSVGIDGLSAEFSDAAVVDAAGQSSVVDSWLQKCQLRRASR